MKAIFAMNMGFAALSYLLVWETGQSRLSQLHPLAPVIPRPNVTAIAPAILNVPPVLMMAAAKQIQPDYGGFLACSVFLDAVVEQF